MEWETAAPSLRVSLYLQCPCSYPRENGPYSGSINANLIILTRFDLHPCQVRAEVDGEDAFDGLLFYPPWVQSYVCFDPRSGRTIFVECES